MASDDQWPFREKKARKARGEEEREIRRGELEGFRISQRWIWRLMRVVVGFGVIFADSLRQNVPRTRMNRNVSSAPEK